MINNVIFLQILESRVKPSKDLKFMHFEGWKVYISVIRANQISFHICQIRLNFILIGILSDFY